MTTVKFVGQKLLISLISLNGFNPFVVSNQKLLILIHKKIWSHKNIPTYIFQTIQWYITDIVVFRQNLLKFLQGAQENKHSYSVPDMMILCPFNPLFSTEETWPIAFGLIGEGIFTKVHRSKHVKYFLSLAILSQVPLPTLSKISPWPEYQDIVKNVNVWLHNWTWIYSVRRNGVSKNRFESSFSRVFNKLCNLICLIKSI